MKQLIYLFIAGLLALTLAACNHQNAAATQAEPQQEGTVLTTVNDSAITKPMIKAYARQRTIPDERATQMQPQLVEELVNVALLSQQAVNDGLDQDPATLNELHIQKQMFLAGKTVNAYLSRNPIGDGELQREYQDQTKQLSGHDYKARHILVETEDQAQVIITKLDGGADFAELAKKKSTGPSGSKGGDLGWFSLDQMVASFSKAAAELKKGAYTKTPIKTRFGWHIIMLEDIRNRQAPPFEQIKERIRSSLKQEMVQSYIQSLREKATITKIN